MGNGTSSMADTEHSLSDNIGLDRWETIGAQAANVSPLKQSALTRSDTSIILCSLFYLLERELNASANVRCLLTSTSSMRRSVAQAPDLSAMNAKRYHTLGNTNI
mmetsp:Transcript_27807/g.81593  ORF Transcript_27807/g.81593 Transcript_27807/m.81593 type:complete len:105 (-) Transcript_27807:21-335(-)